MALTQLRVGAFPTNSVLQTVVNNDNVGGKTYNTTSFTEIATDMRISITPLSASSLLLIRYQFLIGGSNSTLVRQFLIQNVTAGATVDLGHSAEGSRTNCHGSHRNQDADENDVDMITIEAKEVSGSTNARTYTLFGRIESGSDITYLNHTTTDTAAIAYVKPMITIQEIKQ